MIRIRYLKGYHVELADCQAKEVTVLRRNFSQNYLCVMKFSMEVVQGEGGEVVIYDAERVLDNLQTFAVVFSERYLPISHVIELSSPWPFSRSYATAQAFVNSRLGFGYSICVVNLDSIHLPLRIRLLLKEVSDAEFHSYVSKLSEDLKILVEKPEGLPHEILKRAMEDYDDPSIEKPKPSEVPQLKDFNDVKDYLLLLSTEAFLKRLKRALDDDVEIESGGRHPYKVKLKRSGKSAPIPYRAELPGHFPKMLCKELGIDDAYNITCDDFEKMLRKRERLVGG